MRNSIDLAKLNSLAEIGQAVVQLVQESGLLRRKPGRKRGSGKGRKRSARKQAAAQPKVPVRRLVRRQPAEPIQPAAAEQQG